MHDNIETHGQTEEAFPSIIEALKAPGLRPVTLTQVLGDRFIRH